MGYKDGKREGFIEENEEKYNIETVFRKTEDGD